MRCATASCLWLLAEHNRSIVIPDVCRMMLAWSWHRRATDVGNPLSVPLPGIHLDGMLRRDVACKLLPLFRAARKKYAMDSYLRNQELRFMGMRVISDNSG